MKRDHDGFITLHRGRQPIPVRIAYLLVMALSIALFFKAVDAKGQTSVATGGCTLGHTAFTSNEEHCRKNGGVFIPTTYLTTGPYPGRSAMISNSGVTVTNVTRQCDEGWSLVLAGGGYMCARELKEPK